MQLNAYLSYITYNQAMEVVTGAEDAVESPGRGDGDPPISSFWDWDIYGKYADCMIQIW